MSDDQVQYILDLLQAIETGASPWPQQLLEGIVIALAKTAEPGRAAADYRPIVLLSMVYRNWASMRSRQLLQQLAGHIHDDAHGFIPGREPIQTWLQVQAGVELSLQSRTDLIGLSTDVVKAFNTIQRRPLFMMAEHLGVPDTLLHPWQSFLTGLGRRFQVNNKLGPRIGSTIGFPEGCPLSVASTAMVDWALHLYMMEYAPQVRTLSFVDNVDILATEAQLVMMGYFALQTFMSLWGMSLDKTFTWGTTPQARRHIEAFGFPRKKAANELGGSLSFQAGRHTKTFIHRGAGLDDKWARLRKSTAPLAQKLHALAGSFWSHSLHGAIGSLTSDKYLATLRTTAMKALGLQCAGANSLVRFTLEEPATADPGYYDLISSIETFRRICRKTPEIAAQWSFFTQRFTGQFFDGPFSKIYELLGRLEWSVANPPWVYTNHGLCINLLDTDREMLATLLRQAWCDYVVRRTRSRKSLQELPSLCLRLSRVGEAELTPLELARTRAIQEGAFLTPWQHSRYDTSAKAMCPACDQPDTQEHWLRCPRYEEIRAQTGVDQLNLEGIPPFAKQHLLGPVGPHHHELQEYFHHLPMTPSDGSTAAAGLNHVFTDGSCTVDNTTGVATAAWGTVNATTGMPLMAAPLHGVSQTIGRAELWAVVMAIRWAVHQQCHIHIWTDNQAVARRVSGLLHRTDGAAATAKTNHDMRDAAAQWISQTTTGQVVISWVPSHMEEQLCEDSEAEWIARWNGQADSLAGDANAQRGPVFDRLMASQRAHHHYWAPMLHSLKRFFLAVAEHRVKQPRPTELSQQVQLIDDTDWDERVQGRVLSEQATEHGYEGFEERHPRVPIAYVQLLISFLPDVEDPTSLFQPISFTELSLLFLERSDFVCPPTSQQAPFLTWRHPRDQFTRPTLAHVTRQIRSALLAQLRHAQLLHYHVKELDRSEAMIFVKTDGLIVRPSPTARHRMRTRIHEFSGGRGLRRAADMAKPC